MARECIVCEEWCPTSPKAIYLLAAEAVDAAGESRAVRQPYVDPEKCIGCGACEFACPVRDRPAIYVTSIGETRSRENQFILPRKPDGAPQRESAVQRKSGAGSADPGDRKEAPNKTNRMTRKVLQI
jgi:formate hydrogenlyase subunit 6/NADH:ubiquinone oxidoreductase subunit I